MKTTYRILLSLTTVVMLGLTGCRDYLDIVPEKTQELELLFERRDQAFKALSTCYSYIPRPDDLYGSTVLLTDELTTPTRQVLNSIEIMRGKQSSGSSIMLDLWNGYYGGEYQHSLFEGINNCNILIENIVSVPDMDDDEIDTWIAEAEFLKAYYHYLLMQHYGPIPIIDQNIPISAPIEDILVYRNSMDECFDYVIDKIDLVMNALPERVTSQQYLGRIDQSIAMALKSRVALYKASPLYNGNNEYYANLKDKRDENLFSTSQNQELWKEAAEAAKLAIEMASNNNFMLYEYSDVVPDYDEVDYSSSAFTRSLYNYRYMMVDKWNSELIWGNSQPVTDWWTVLAASFLKNPDETNEAAWQWLSPTLRMAELYYTKNGLPIDEDLSFDYDNRYTTTKIGTSHLGYAQYNETTARLHLNREPRFYASIGFDRGYVRAYDEKNELSLRKDENNGRSGSSNDYLVTGYALKKYNHPASETKSYDDLIKYAWPMIRMAELYLNYAEAMNEFYGPSQEVYDALNTVRGRVGLPNIETIWSDATKAKTVNKHQTKEGLREIIQHERLIELAFEGHRYNDIRRWKRGEEFFNTPVRGWSADESEVNNFYTIIEVGQRVFQSPKDYLQPLSLDELTRNSNLVQNPGW